MGLGAQSLVWPNEFCYALINAGFRVVRFDNRHWQIKTSLSTKNSPRSHDSPIGQKPNYWADSDWFYRLKTCKHHYDLYDMAEDAYQLLKIFWASKILCDWSIDGRYDCANHGGALSPPSRKIGTIIQ